MPLALRFQLSPGEDRRIMTLFRIARTASSLHMFRKFFCSTEVKLFFRNRDLGDQFTHHVAFVTKHVDSCFLVEFLQSKMITLYIYIYIFTIIIIVIIIVICLFLLFCLQFAQIQKKLHTQHTRAHTH